MCLDVTELSSPPLVVTAVARTETWATKRVTLILGVISRRAIVILVEVL